MTHLHFTINSVAATDPSSGTAFVTPASTPLSVGTVTGHVPRVSTHTTNNAGSVVLALGAIILAMTYLATVLTSLVLVVTEGTVESSQLSKLVSLELVLTLGD